MPKMMEVTPANLSRLLLSLRKTMPTTESAAMTTADHTAYATEVSCVVKGGDISGCGASSTQAVAGRPVGWPLPGSAELLRAATRALTKHRSRASALPRGHFDHAGAPLNGFEAVGRQPEKALDEGRVVQGDLEARRGRRRKGLVRGERLLVLPLQLHLVRVMVRVMVRVSAPIQVRVR